MAAGKSEMVKQIVQKLNGSQSLTASPTFALRHEYQGAYLIQHWDLYRLQDIDELETSGFWDQFSGLNNSNEIIFVEWSERLKPEWISNNWELYFVKIDLLESGNRKITVSKRVSLKKL
jgi:tRNA threonylcarbamoyladenosine biosynthesis protein TsaE